MNEVKRQAMMELQKAVTSAEQKATELVATERAKMDRALAEARTQARDEILSTLNHQEESSEVLVHSSHIAQQDLHIQSNFSKPDMLRT